MNIPSQQVEGINHHQQQQVCVYVCVLET
jgi:hypothetical protein